MTKISGVFSSVSSTVVAGLSFVARVLLGRSSRSVLSIQTGSLKRPLPRFARKKSCKRSLHPEIRR